MDDEGYCWKPAIDWIAGRIGDDVAVLDAAAAEVSWVMDGWHLTMRMGITIVGFDPVDSAVVVIVAAVAGGMAHFWPNPLVERVASWWWSSLWSAAAQLTVARSAKWWWSDLAQSSRNAVVGYLSFVFVIANMLGTCLFF